MNSRGAFAARAILGRRGLARLVELPIRVDLHQVPRIGEVPDDFHRELDRLRSHQDPDALQAVAVECEEMGPSLGHADRGHGRIARVDEQLERPLPEQRAGDLVDNRGAELAVVETRDLDLEGFRAKATADDPAPRIGDDNAAVGSYFPGDLAGGHANPKATRDFPQAAGRPESVLGIEGGSLMGMLRKFRWASSNEQRILRRA